MSDRRTSFSSLSSSFLGLGPEGQLQGTHRPPPLRIPLQSATYICFSPSSFFPFTVSSLDVFQFNYSRSRVLLFCLPMGPHRDAYFFLPLAIDFFPRYRFPFSPGTQCRQAPFFVFSTDPSKPTIPRDPCSAVHCASISRAFLSTLPTEPLYFNSCVFFFFVVPLICSMKWIELRFFFSPFIPPSSSSFSL